MLAAEQPRSLIGSPMCTYFSRLIQITVGRIKAAGMERRYERAVRHFEFACELYLQQISQGGLTLHELPTALPSGR